MRYYTLGGDFMINFFVGLLLTAIIFSACFVACAAFTSYAVKRPSPPTIKHDSPQEESPQPRVYYLSSRIKNKQKRPKSRTIALKGALMPKGTVVVADANALQKSAHKAGTRTSKAASGPDQSRPSYTRKKSTAASSTAARASANYSPTRSPSPQRRSR